MTRTPLGDQAILVECPDEAAAVAFAESLRTRSPAWLEDVVPAYARVGVFFDPDRISLPEVEIWLESEDQSRLVAGSQTRARTPRIWTLPVCYERGPDLDDVAQATGQDRDQVVAAHLGTLYTVYAIGFVPGFPYLGYLPEVLRGVGRRASPRVRVEPGSVGLTGTQTGIYPLPSPGGWNLIGQTPLTIVEVATGFFPIRVGDQIQFARMDETEFTRRVGDRLEA